MESALDDHVEQERHRSLGLRVDVWESANEVSPKVGLARGKTINMYLPSSFGSLARVAKRGTAQP